jgi:hypothetical protein
VAHGYTTYGETDTYAVFKKTAAASGGLLIYSLMENSAEAINLYVSVGGGTASTTKTGAGRSLAEFLIWEHDGANGLANVTANGNVFGIRVRSDGGWNTRWICDEDGDTWQSGSLFLGAVELSETDLDDLTDGGETALHSHAGGGGGGAAADVTVDDAALDKFLGPFDEETDDLQDLIDYIDETGTEVVQSDAEPETTYPGMIWMDTDAEQAPGIGGNWVLIEETTVSASTLDWTVSGLDGNTNKELMVKFQMSESGGGGSNAFKMQYNGDTGNNYDRQGHWWGASHSANDITASAFIWLVEDNSGTWDGTGEARMPLTTGTQRYVRCQTTREQGAGNNYSILLTGHWTDTSSNITSVRFFTDSAVTATLRVYRWQETRASDIALSGWQLVESKSHSSGTLSWDIENLLGDTTPRFRLIVDYYKDLRNSTFNEIWIQFNDDTGGNYDYEFHNFGDTFADDSKNGESNILIGGTTALDECVLDGVVYAKRNSSLGRHMLFRAYRSGESRGYDVAGIWKNTADEIVSIQVTSEGSCEFEGSLYRWVD